MIALRLPRADVHEPIPVESRHPASFTARTRAHMLADPGELATRRIRQVEYRMRFEEAEHALQDARAD